MKKLIILPILIFLCLEGFSQKKLLVDCIHGADYYYVSWEGYPELIDFEALFPDYEITKIASENLQFTEILFDENHEGSQDLTYQCDLPENIPEGPIALYVVVINEDDSVFKMVNGSIINPDSIVVAEMFNGVMHYDGAHGSNWQINISLQTTYSYHIAIAYGPVLYSSLSMSGEYDLNDFDIVLRIKDNTWYAINGNSPDYSDIDLVAFSDAFNNGLGILNVYNLFESMIEKPFVHFSSLSNNSIDFEVNIPGSKKYAVPEPDKSGRKLTWKNYNLKAKQTSEIVYEAILDAKLNFLYFKEKGDQLAIQNRIKSSIYDLKLLKYYGNGKYKYLVCKEIKPYENITVNKWKLISAGQLLQQMKNDMYVEAIRNGLTKEEANHFVYSYAWIESLLSRAYKQPEQLFGLYRFDTETYNSLIPFYSNPYPENITRNMWVMLSNIQNQAVENTISLPLAYDYEKLVENGLKMTEYGVVNEYYSMKNGLAEDEFFGITLENYLYYYYDSQIEFYDNMLASVISQDVDSLILGNGSYIFGTSNAAELGIIYDTAYRESPLSLAFKLHDNGRQIALGTSEYFNGDSLNTIFLNNCLNAIYDGNYFVSAKAPSSTVYNYKLRVNPNPFSNEVYINFQLPERSHVLIEIFNLQGQLIKTITSDKLDRGTYEYIWKATNNSHKKVNSGIYLCKLQLGQVLYSTKIIHLE